MKHKVMGSLIFICSLLLFFIPTHTVYGADVNGEASSDVIFTVRDSSFLALNPDYLEDGLSGFDRRLFIGAAIEDSFVPGLSTWKIQLYPGPWVGSGESTPWYVLSSELYQVGDNLYLTSKQAVRIPVNQISKKSLGFYPGSFSTEWAAVWQSFYQATIKNNRAVTLWKTPAYDTPVQWVAPDTTWLINRAYFSYDTGLWFDIGADQWVSANYLYPNLGKVTWSSLLD